MVIKYIEGGDRANIEGNVPLLSSLIETVLFVRSLGNFYHYCPVSTIYITKYDRFPTSACWDGFNAKSSCGGQVERVEGCEDCC